MSTLLKTTFTAILIISTGLYTVKSQSPVDYARSVANRVINDSSFELHEVKAREVSFPAICHPGKYSQEDTPAACLLNIETSRQGTFRFGFSGDQPFEVKINGSTIFIYGNKGSRYPKEIAYDTYEFDEYYDIELNYPITQFEIISIGDVSFGVVNQKGEKDESVTYGKPTYLTNNTKDIKSKELRYAIAEHAAFKNHPYTEWHYANGATMMGIQYLADLTGDDKYDSFVQLFCDTNITNLALFRHQYDNGSLYTQNYRYFRYAMLDDTSAPALPYMEKHLRSSLDHGVEMIQYIADYVAGEQTRLPDGTFVRPEPKWTLWADDLFMSVPFMLRYAKKTGDREFIEDAVRQIINYDKYLFDPSLGLYHHGWYVYNSKPAGSYWGRANGWIAWATSEALSLLPVDHPKYEIILQIHNKQLSNIINYQAASGRWHQLLHDKSSYEETSCTALFVLAIAKGVRMGWLPADYSQYAFKGWEGIKSKIDITNGVVSDICKSTAIGPDEEFYRKQARRDNDPRGLGAVLTAAVEIERLTQHINNK